MSYIKEITHRLTGSTAAAITKTTTQLNGILSEIRYNVVADKMSTSVLLKLYRGTTANENLIFKTFCPSSHCSYRPRARFTNLSTAGGSVNDTTAAGMAPVLFMDEPLKVIVGTVPKSSCNHADLKIYMI